MSNVYGFQEMAYLITILIGILTHAYNYRKLYKFREGAEQGLNLINTAIMSNTDSDRIEALQEALNEFKIEMVQRVTTIEASNKIYFGGYSVLSILIFLVNLYVTKMG